MDDDIDERDDSKRKSRNLSEKKRRDQFNLLVNELSSMVSANNRKMDKSTVLKSTIAFLKSHNEIAVRSRVHEIQEDWKPSFLSNEEFTHLILEALDGFIIIFSSSGKIIYASESITSLLGHLPGDLTNMTIYDLSYEEDHTELYNLMLHPSNIVDPLQNGIQRENQILFSCHIKKGAIESQENITFELVQFTGYFRSDVELENVFTSTRNASATEIGKPLIFVGTGRLSTPQLIREMTIIDNLKSEFTSRHSLEWKFLFLDHRAPPIIGYLPFEVLGTSGYDYYHFDDLEKVGTCHEALLQKGEGTSCFYRFLTKGQQWIWLQTRFYITYHQWNSKPEFVVCTHRVVSYSDVLKHARNVTSTENHIYPAQENETDDCDSSEKQLPSSSMAVHSPWSSKNSRVSRKYCRFTTTPSSPSVKERYRHHGYHCGTGSDSTSISAESIASKQSISTQYSSRPRMRPGSTLKPPVQSIIQQPQQHQLINHQLTVLPTPSHSPNVHHQRHTPTSQLISSTSYVSPQYLTTIPVQPVLSASFPGATAVISPIAAPSELLHPSVVMTPAQNQVQDELQRKHQELQHLIVQQQEELRRVSEQLIMARYGLLPAIVNVTLPFSSNVGSTGGHNVISELDCAHQQSQQLIQLDQLNPQPQQAVLNPSNPPEPQESNGSSNAEMISYLQLSSNETTHHVQPNHGTAQQVNEPQPIHQISINNELEGTPYHMSQAQIAYPPNIESPNSVHNCE